MMDANAEAFSMIRQYGSMFLHHGDLQVTVDYLCTSCCYCRWRTNSLVLKKWHGSTEAEKLEWVVCTFGLGEEVLVKVSFGCPYDEKSKRSKPAAVTVQSIEWSHNQSNWYS